MSESSVSEAANALRVDFWTAEVVGAMRDADVSPVLLKGPVIAAWLYGDDPHARGYNDADLLVPPDGHARAIEVLDRLAYHPVATPGLSFRHGVPSHAQCWFRDRDGAAIDLHSTIHGAERLDPAAIWRAVIEDRETIDLLGTSVDTPGEPFRLVHLVLHVRPKDQPGSRAWTDLERAVAAIPEQRWRLAADLAERLGVADRMGPLLRLTEPGRQLADQLGLPDRWPLHLQLEYHADSNTAARFVAEFLQITWPDRFRLVKEWVAPPPEQLRSRWPVASRGSLGLALVYVLRVARLPWRVAKLLFSMRSHRSTDLRRVDAFPTS